jgi:hypothetical protein
MDVDKVMEGVTHWLTQAARLGAIVFFLFCGYEGLFKGGGSTMIFIGVLSLSFPLVICYFIVKLHKVLNR